MMMLFNEKFKTDSNRLKNWDYSSEAVYFVTIVTKNRESIFGNIKEEKMILNENGKIIERELLRSIKIRKNWFFHNWIIMPNHIHLLIEIQNDDISTQTDRTFSIVETHCNASKSSMSIKERNESLSTNVAETHCSASLQCQSDEIADSKLYTTNIVETHSSASTSNMSTTEFSESLRTNVAETHCGASLQNQSDAITDSESSTMNIVETHSSASTSSMSITEHNESLSKNVAETHCGASLQYQSDEIADSKLYTTNIVETHRSASTSSISTKKCSESEFSRKSNSISSFVAIFKSITTKQINGAESIWQTNYHDHIVRNYKTFEKIYDYIKHNPISWDTDSLK